MFRDLAYVSTLRGEDSTGLIAVHHKKGRFRYRFEKRLVDPVGFMNLADIHKLLVDTTNTLTFMGHARAATVGKINVANAHPFEHGRIVGMHNGTIKCLSREKITDSEEMIKRIDEGGIQAAVDSLTGSDRDCAYAFNWLDTKEQTINFLRNSERPLWFMNDTKKQTVLWASERCFLRLISDRSARFWCEPELLAENMLATLDLEELKPRMTPVVRKQMFSTYIADKEVPSSVLASLGGYGPAIIGPGSRIPPPLPASSNVSGEKVLVKFNTTHSRMDHADEVFNHVMPKGGLPRRIMVRCPLSNDINVQTTTEKTLFYVGPAGRPELISSVVPLLEKGCLISKKKAKLFDKVYWVGPHSYVLPYYQDDQLVTDNIDPDFQPRFGYAVYATLGSVVNSRKARNALQNKIDGPTVKELFDDTPADEGVQVH